MDFDFSKSPETALVKQKLLRKEIPDVFLAASRAFQSLDFPRLRPGQTVAVAAGSRGIDRIDQAISACVQFFKEKGAKPFIVPAMGSHGGATPDGQNKVLEKLGISYSALGAEIRSHMDTEIIGKLPSGLVIHFAKEALGADWVFPVNRIKPHTKFKLPIESGVCKMLTIGLGKDKGAAHFHKKAIECGFGIIEHAAAKILQEQRILAGLALLEDGCGKLSEIEILSPPNLIEREKKLLQKAYAQMARIPLDNIDILIVDRMGKDISGIGMDSNVTGRHRDIVGDFFTTPHAKRIFVRELSPATDGNANGVGLADVVTTRLVRSIDMEKTKVNAVTAISPEKAATPIHFETDIECLSTCAITSGIENLENARIVRIQDTKNLETFWVSKAFETEIINSENLELAGSWAPFLFDGEDNLI